MAIVALTLLAAPAFAGEFGHQIVLDAGFGMSMGGEDYPGYTALTDGATRFGVSGTLDDNNSIYIMWDMGGMSMLADAMNAPSYDAAGPSVVGNSTGNMGEFTSTTNVLGAFGVTDVPVTLSLTQGYGRIELHNRFNQWTGWEWTTRKDAGDPRMYGRAYKIELVAGIMNMVNVKIGFNPEFNGSGDIPLLVDVWASFAAGPANLDVSAYIINHTGESGGWLYADAYMAAGGEVQANMSFGMISLMAALNFMTEMPAAEGAEGISHLMIAVKPTVAVGPATLGLGVWFNMDFGDESRVGDSADMSMAVDLSASIAMVTFFGGMRMKYLNPEDFEGDLSDYNIWEMGATVGMGATSVTIGVNGGDAATGGADGDMRAVDNTVGINPDPDSNTCLYVKFSTQMW